MILLPSPSRGTHLNWNVRNVVRRSAQDCAVSNSSIVHREICGDQVLGQPASALHHGSNGRAFELRHQSLDTLHVDCTAGRSLKRIGPEVLGEIQKSYDDCWVEVIHLGQDLLPDVVIERRSLADTNRPTQMNELGLQRGLCQMNLSKGPGIALSAPIYLWQYAHSQSDDNRNARSNCGRPAGSFCSPHSRNTKDCGGQRAASAEADWSQKPRAHHMFAGEAPQLFHCYPPIPFRS